MSRASVIAVVLCAVLTFPILFGIGATLGIVPELIAIPFMMIASCVICWRVAAR